MDSRIFETTLKQSPPSLSLNSIMLLDPRNMKCFFLLGNGSYDACNIGNTNNDDVVEPNFPDLPFDLTFMGSPNGLFSVL